MAEERNNAIARAGNIANKLHGTAQVVRGAVTADFVAVASGAVKLVSPKVIAVILAVILLTVLMPVLVMFSLPQAIFNWGTLQDSELLSRHEHCSELNQCARLSASEAKPGDLVFFKGTYNAGETVTHIGIYVGNNRMLRCGNPIQYTSIDTNYWRNHFYAYGRIS